MRSGPDLVETRDTRHARLRHNESGASGLMTAPPTGPSQVLELPTPAGSVYLDIATLDAGAFGAAPAPKTGAKPVAQERRKSMAATALSGAALPPNAGLHWRVLAKISTLRNQALGAPAPGRPPGPSATSRRRRSSLLLSSRESAEAKGEERSRRLSRLEQPDPQPPPPEDRRTSMVTSDDPIFLTAEDAKARATVRAKRLEERAAKEERVRVMWKHFVARRAILGRAILCARNSAQFSDRRLHRLLSGHERPRRQRGDCQAPRDRASQSSCAQA